MYSGCKPASGISDPMKDLERYHFEEKYPQGVSQLQVVTFVRNLAVCMYRVSNSIEKLKILLSGAVFFIYPHLFYFNMPSNRVR